MSVYHFIKNFYTAHRGDIQKAKSDSQHRNLLQYHCVISKSYSFITDDLIVVNTYVNIRTKNRPNYYFSVFQKGISFSFYYNEEKYEFSIDFEQEKIFFLGPTYPSYPSYTISLLINDVQDLDPMQKILEEDSDKIALCRNPVWDEFEKIFNISK